MGCGRFLVVVVTTAACGRVSFDARPDASDGASDGNPADADPLATHDEDGDGINDRDDVCPHIADMDQADNDGDRVGNACDPLTDAALERIILFDPLISQEPPWEFSGTVPPTYTGDAVTFDLRNGNMFMALTTVAPAKDHLVVGGYLGATSPTNIRQLSLAAVETLTEFAYCEKYEENTGPIEKWGLVWTPDNASFYTEDAGALTETIANHAFRTSLAHNPFTSDVECETTFPVDKPQLTAPVSTAIVPVQYMIYAQGIDLRLDYVVVIRTDPP